MWVSSYGLCLSQRPVRSSGLARHVEEPAHCRGGGCTKPQACSRGATSPRISLSRTHAITTDASSRRAKRTASSCFVVKLEASVPRPSQYFGYCSPVASITHPFSVIAATRRCRATSTQHHIRTLPSSVVKNQSRRSEPNKHDNDDKDDESKAHVSPPSR